jgi:Fe-S oxidoreductase
MPRTANAMIDFAPVRAVMQRTLGLSIKRTLPHYAGERFDRWFHRRPHDQRHAPAKTRVVLWDDTFVRYHEPHIGVAAVKVLEALGFEVTLAQQRKCCGRPAFSQGNLDYAAELGAHNINLLSSSSYDSDTPIVFLEPSCWSMFVEDYRELGIANAAVVANRSFLFEQFVDDHLARHPAALPFRNGTGRVAIHAHCHAKSIIKPQFMARLAARIPGAEATLLETGCCGMAGAFGMLESKYDLSVQVAGDLTAKIDAARPDVVVASGTSCRHQLCDLTNRQPQHMAELLAAALP